METAQKPNRSFVIAGVVVGALALFAIGARAFVADAFGGPMDALEAIPADMDAVFVADLAQIRDFADSELLEYAIRAGQDTGELPAGDPGEAFLGFIEDELGIDMEDDVLSWIGRSAAFGVSGDLANDADPDSVIAAFTVRNPDAAWRFIDLVVERTLEEVPSAVTEETTVDGLRVVILDSGEDPAHFGVKGDHMVIAGDRDSIEAAYATLDSGESVLDVEWFAASNAELDRDAWIKVIVDPKFMNDTFAEMSEFTGDAGFEQPSSLTSLGMSFGIDGDRISMEAFYEQEDPFDQSPVSPLPLSMLSDLRNTPDALFGFGLADDFGARIIEQMEDSGGGELEQLTEWSQDAFGVDFVSQGLAQLGSHLIITMASDTLATGGDIDIAVGVADRTPLVRAFEEMRTKMAGDGVETSGQDGLIRFVDQDIVVGVLGNEVVFRLDQSGAGSGPFADSEGFAWLEENFSRGAFVYVDIYRIMQGGLDNEMDEAFLDDLEAMRMGATFDTGERSVRFSAIVEINLAEHSVTAGR